MINSPLCTGGGDFVFVHFFFSLFFFSTLTDDRSGNCRPTAAHTRTESHLFAAAFAVVFAHLWLFVLTARQCPELRGCSAGRLGLNEELFLLLSFFSSVPLVS